MNRRRFLTLLGALGASSSAMAASSDMFPLTSDAGAALINQRVPSDLDPSNLPGAVRAGSMSPDVILVEFFDYNCGFCRGAVHQLDEVVSGDANLQLRLYNNPIIAPGSVEAAKVQQAVLRALGPQVAYAYHVKLLSIHGPANHDSALGVAREMGLDLDPILTGYELPRVASVVAMQLDSAKALDLTATPSFLLNGVEVLGWPGPHRVADMVRSVRACDQPLCANLIRG